MFMKNIQKGIGNIWIMFGGNIYLAAEQHGPFSADDEKARWRKPGLLMVQQPSGTFIYSTQNLDPR